MNENNNNNSVITEKRDNNSDYNISSKISFYLSLVVFVIFLIGYIWSGGSFNESGSGAIWWVVFPIIMITEPWLLLISVILGVIGLKGNKKILAIVSLTINLLKIIYYLILFF